MSALDDALEGRLAPGVHTVDELPGRHEAGDLVGERGWRLFSVDLAGASDKDVLLDRFAEALDFPAWAGRNWDAFADLLGDLSWAPASGYVMTVEGADVASPAWLVTRSILDDTVRGWAAEATSFVVLIRPATGD